jgi:hypothetical protein
MPSAAEFICCCCCCCVDELLSFDRNENALVKSDSMELDDDDWTAGGAGEGEGAPTPMLPLPLTSVGEEGTTGEGLGAANRPLLVARAGVGRLSGPEDDTADAPPFADDAGSGAEFCRMIGPPAAAEGGSDRCSS